MRTLCPHITLHSFLEPHLWLKVNLIVCHNSRFISSLLRIVARHARNTQHIFLIFLCSRCRKVAHIQKQIHENARVTDALIQNLSQVMSPTGSSTTRSLLNRTILPAMKTIRLTKLRVMSKLCPTTSNCCLPLKILLKALLRLKEADLDDEQIRALLASPRYLLERGESAERSQVYHSERESLMSSSS